MKDKLSRDLTTGNILGQLIRFTAPLFVSNLLQTAYHIVDMAVVGQYQGSVGLSAVSVCTDILNIMTFISVGLSNSGQVLVSQYTGANKPDKVKMVIGNIFSLMFLISATLMSLALIFNEQLLNLSNIPPEARAGGKVYLITCVSGLIFTYGYNAVGAILRGMGDSKHPFVFVAIASVTNIVLDLLFVAVFNWGVFGAAFATVLSQGLSLVCSLVFLFKNRERFGFDFAPASFALKGEAVGPILKLGIPMALQGGLIQSSKLIVTRWVNDYGVYVSAVSGIGAKFASITLTFSYAIQAGGSAMIGQCIGAKKQERVFKCLMACFGLALGTISVLAALTAVFPKQIFGIFTNDLNVLELTGVYVPVVIVTMYGSACRVPMNALINGTGKSVMNLVLAVADGLAGHIGLSALLGFGLGMGLNGIWYGNAVAGYIPFVIGIWFYFSGYWKKGQSWAER